MAIAKKPKGNTVASAAPASDPKAEAFIAGAAKAAGPAVAPPAPPAAPPPDAGKIPVMLRFDAALLRRIDEAAKRRCISRTAWVQFTLSRFLDGEEV